MGLKDEILEQPSAIARLLELQAPQAKKVAAKIRDSNVKMVFLAARGTSDNAGLYAKYLWGAFNGLPVALAAPSLFSIYETPPLIKDSLVVGISQSGQSPDIVRVVKEGRRQGGLTLAITNDPMSPLAQEADLVFDTMAGPETAVAATKTYTTQLVSIAMISAALTGNAEQRQWIERLPELAEATLSLDDRIRSAAARYRYMDQCVVLGRGFNYSTVYEWALKLKELAYVIAEPYSSADFQHGPVALACQGFPVFAVVPGGRASDNVINLLTNLVQEQQVELLAISNEASALALANTPLQLPDRLPEWITPIPAIIPAQLFCYHLTRAKGYNTEGPRGLSKVTLTW
ncbi:MAG: SIS domain-containing protein [bacterium]|nr:SIS domain-containing protein [bacterium]